MEDARWCRAPGVIPSQQLHLVGSDDADQFRNCIKPCGCTVCQPWVYLRLGA